MAKSNTPVVAVESVEAEIERLRAENANLKAKAGAQVVNRLSFRVSELGAVSVYGLGRFPVTLYREQWTRLLGISEDLKAFFVTNNSSLAQGKDDPRFASIRAARAAAGK